MFSQNHQMELFSKTRPMDDPVFHLLYNSPYEVSTHVLFFVCVFVCKMFVFHDFVIALLKVIELHICMHM